MTLKVKLEVTNLNYQITRVHFRHIFVLVTDKKSYVGFQMMVSLLMFDDLERSNSRSKFKSPYTCNSETVHFRHIP